MGCGCGKDLSDPDRARRVKMRFVGRPNGVLMRGAKSNYTHGEVYDVPWAWAQYKFWEVLEPLPQLKVPEMTTKDNVFEETVFLPDINEGFKDSMPPELRKQLYDDEGQILGSRDKLEPVSPNEANTSLDKSIPVKRRRKKVDIEEES